MRNAQKCETKIDGCKITQSSKDGDIVTFFTCVARYKAGQWVELVGRNRDIIIIFWSDVKNSFDNWNEFINNLLNTNCMSDNVNNGVGANPIPEKLKGTWHQDLAAGTYTAADLIALAVAQGATFNDGTAITAGNAVIEQIEIDLKPINGHGQIWDGTQFVQQTSTAADATYTDNGGVTDLDPGGSRDSATCEGSTFQSLTVATGSIATVAVVFCEA